MAWDDFGKSWIKIIANPAGYSAQRKSPSEAARIYASQHSPSQFLKISYDELSFKENRNKWIDGCASKLKSDDVGKSIANCRNACAGEYDRAAETLTKSGSIITTELIAQQQKEDEVARQKKILMMVMIAIVAAFAIFIVLRK